MAMQFLMNGVLAAGPLALAGLAVALLFRAGGFFNLALGAIFTLGGFLVFAFHVCFGMPLLIAAPLAVTVCGALGVLGELLLFSPLRGKKAGPLVLLLASLGLYILLYGLVEIIFGPNVQMIRSSGVRPTVQLLGARATAVQLATLATAVGMAISLSWTLRFARLGVALRAISEDAELASVSGVAVTRTRIWASAVGAGVAAVCGLLVGMDTDLLPGMGMHILFGGLVVGIVGGIRSVGGIMLAALLLGLAQHLGVWKIGAQWQDAIAFAILLVFLLVRPEGFLGKKTGNAIV